MAHIHPASRGLHLKWLQVHDIHSLHPNTESGYSASGIRGEDSLRDPTLLAPTIGAKSARRSIPEPDSRRVSGQSDEFRNKNNRQKISCIVHV